MRIMCAWCQGEGKDGFIREAPGESPDSHGVCRSHYNILLKEIRDGAIQGRPAEVGTREGAAV